MNAKTEVGKEIVNVTKDLSGHMGNVISILAEKLSVPVEHLYEVLRTQMIVEGVISILFMIVLTFGSLILLFHLGSKQNELENNSIDIIDTDGEFYFTLFVVALIALIVAFILDLCCLSDSVTKIVNPDYHVLKTITKMVR